MGERVTTPMIVADSNEEHARASTLVFSSSCHVFPRTLKQVVCWTIRD